MKTYPSLIGNNNLLSVRKNVRRYNIHNMTFLMIHII